MMALEHGAQQVWSSTVVAPPGTFISNFFFICGLTDISLMMVFAIGKV